MTKYFLNEARNQDECAHGVSSCQSAKTMLHIFLSRMIASVLKYYDKKKFYVCTCMLSCSKMNIMINIHIGRGVRSTIPRQRGHFLLVYSGQIISKKEGERRERKNPSGYRYFYRDLW